MKHEACPYCQGTEISVATGFFCDPISDYALVTRITHCKTCKAFLGSETKTEKRAPRQDQISKS